MKRRKKRTGRNIAILMSSFAAIALLCFLRRENTESYDFGDIGDKSSVIAYTDAEYPSAESAVNLNSFKGDENIDGEQENASQSEERNKFVGAVWLSYLDIEDMLYQKSEGEFTEALSSAFDNIASFGLNTVFMQVRPFSDALYRSEIFPFSYLCTGTEGEDPGFDPLEIAVDLAHEKNLKIEAWVNPFRVRSNLKEPISDKNPALKLLNEGDAVEYNGGVYYNPASERARELIADGIAEIVENYDVDGIHFDDYFYPTKDESFDAAQYEDYLQSGGDMSLFDWRRENVNELVRLVYKTIKEIDKSVLFGISPQGNNKNNFEGQFIDTEKWLSVSGYIDYLAPQIYYGFNNSSLPFRQTADEFMSMAEKGDVKLYAGLAAYKTGIEDKWAGASGKDEWKNSSDILARQLMYAKESGYDGFALFRYESLFSKSISEHTEAERENLRDAVENIGEKSTSDRDWA